jgi:hypothetical protein
MVAGGAIDLDEVARSEILDSRRVQGEHVYTPPPPNATPPAQPNPASVNLYDNIERLNLAVDQILPLHGRKVPLAELQKWIGKAS